MSRGSRRSRGKADFKRTKRKAARRRRKDTPKPPCQASGPSQDTVSKAWSNFTAVGTHAQCRDAVGKAQKGVSLARSDVALVANLSGGKVARFGLWKTGFPACTGARHCWPGCCGYRAGGAGWKTRHPTLRCLLGEAACREVRAQTRMGASPWGREVASLPAGGDGSLQPPGSAREGGPPKLYTRNKTQREAIPEPQKAWPSEARIFQPLLCHRVWSHVGVFRTTRLQSDCEARLGLALRSAAPWQRLAVESYERGGL